MQSNITIKQALITAHQQLRDVSSSAAIDARLLLQYTLDYSPEKLISFADQLLTNTEYAKYTELILQRVNHTPIAYIVGYREFYSHNFIINANVLIPRADTEILVDAVIDYYQHLVKPMNILELGVGSGCIIISLLLALPNITALAVDISAAAILLCQINAKKFAVDSRLTVKQSDWFTQLSEDKFDIIVANPPYIDITEIDYMAAETIKFEPHIALFADEDGLAHYHTIADTASKYLNNNGRIYLEIGFRQKIAVQNIFTKAGYRLIDVYHDYNGHDRIICFTKII